MRSNRFVVEPARGQFMATPHEIQTDEQSDCGRRQTEYRQQRATGAAHLATLKTEGDIREQRRGDHERHKPGEQHCNGRELPQVVAPLLRLTHLRISCAPMPSTQSSGCRIC